MRVARLELKDIGPFEDAVFEIPEPKGPGELVLFEGPNGSGKTTIVEAIAVAAGQFTNAPLVAPAGSWAQRFRSPDGAADIVLAHEAQLLHYTRTRAGVSQVLVQASGVGALLTHGHGDPAQRLAWTAFAYNGHHLTPVVETKGPAEIEALPLHGSLSFGAYAPASSHFGQLIVNLDQEVAKAYLEAHREGASSDRRQEMEQRVASRQKGLDEIARALSVALARKVTFEVPVGQHAPIVSIDGEPIPLDLLGEGMRSTLAWLSDLLVRLHRIPWEDATRSPLEQDFWLILDEIEESLHPTMQARILPALRELFPNARIYATTHSPFVVASAAAGTIFAIRPGRDHRVRGKVEPRPLEPGQSLEWVISEIFQARTGFIDQGTRDDLEAHDRDIRRFQRKVEIDWDAFLARRDRIMSLNEEVRTVAAMQEVRVRAEIDRRLLARSEARRLQAGA